MSCIYSSPRDGERELDAMLQIAWITLRRIAEKAVLVQFGILALVLMYVGLGLDAIIQTVVDYVREH